MKECIYIVKVEYMSYGDAFRLRLNCFCNFSLGKITLLSCDKGWVDPLTSFNMEKLNGS